MSCESVATVAISTGGRGDRTAGVLLWQRDGAWKWVRAARALPARRRDGRSGRAPFVLVHYSENRCPGERRLPEQARGAPCSESTLRGIEVVLAEEPIGAVRDRCASESS